MDPDSVVFNKQTEVLNPIKQKCLATLEQTSMEGASKELTDFRTPQKITFQTPKTPKSGYGDELSISLETVKEKAKHSVLFIGSFYQQNLSTLLPINQKLFSAICQKHS